MIWTKFWWKGKVTLCWRSTTCRAHWGAWEISCLCDKNSSFKLSVTSTAAASATWLKCLHCSSVRPQWRAGCQSRLLLRAGTQMTSTPKGVRRAMKLQKPNSSPYQQPNWRPACKRRTTAWLSTGAERASRSPAAGVWFDVHLPLCLKGVHVRGNDCPGSFLVQFLLGKD